MRPARPGSLRFIGGRWRGRRVTLSACDGLRPTPDRVRETLFNWLAPLLPGARCLDGFAGSGMLGLEALSRGAGSCSFVERNKRQARAVEQAARMLQAAGWQVVIGTSPSIWSALEPPFDLVFLDPPFAFECWPALLRALPPLLAPAHRVYLEFAARNPPALTTGWHVLREQRAGAVGYRLATWCGDGQDGCP